MSCYGKRWIIGGVTAGLILRDTANSRYSVVIEREFAELPEIETIDWTAPAIQAGEDNRPGEAGLPEGCGFAVQKITYDSADRSYTVYLQLAKQYLGDVTGYQAQLQELEQTAEELRDSVEALQTQLAETDELVLSLYEASLSGGEESGTGESVSGAEETAEAEAETEAQG